MALIRTLCGALIRTLCGALIRTLCGALIRTLCGALIRTLCVPKWCDAAVISPVYGQVLNSFAATHCF